MGLGDYTGMTNVSLVKKLARQDGILLKPDRPMTPMDCMFGAVIGVKRGLPDYAKGGRLWATHSSVAVENATTAPELATNPTRRLVSHQGVDNTLHQTIANALSGTRFFLQYLVVAVDVKTSFVVVDSDLYPTPSAVGQEILFYRGVSQKKCVDGQDAVASGCVNAVKAAGQLMDAAGDKMACEASGQCLHTVAAWQVFAGQADTNVIFLGDLNVYVSASGYRFRLDQGGENNRVIIVGQPNESVEVTWLSRNSSSSWIAHVKTVEVGVDGRVGLDL